MEVKTVRVVRQQVSVVIFDTNGEVYQKKAMKRRNGVHFSCLMRTMKE